MNSSSAHAGDQPTQIPGLTLPIDYALPREKRFLHGVNEWAQDPRLTAREISMLRLMNALTDKPRWNEKIFQADIVARWREEASKLPLISEAAWEWCLLELRDKAKYFEKNGFVLTLDTGSRCAKSDTLVDESLRTELCEAVKPLLQQEEKDWHPNSNDQVLNLVHPSLFPLVYGITLVTEPGIVGLDNFVEVFGKGKVLQPDQTVSTRSKGNYDYSNPNDLRAWSNKFQWLPCEVKFTEQSGTNVRIMSYINNLHPNHHHEALYAVIENIIARSVPLWNEILIRDEVLGRGGSGRLLGRTPPRIQTFGCEADELNLPEWIEEIPSRPGQTGDEDAVERVKEYLQTSEHPDKTFRDGESELARMSNTGRWVEDGDAPSMVRWKAERLRRVVHPEPGAAYSYEDWKAGRTDAAVVPSDRQDILMQRHHYYDISLQDTFRKQGLQVIVKLASIELTPEKPEYPGGKWHLEGMLNEHIVATSIYYYDVSNTTDSRIHFRQEDMLEDMDLIYEQDDHGPLSEIFGTDSMREENAVQELGAIKTPQGRLLCFPNTLQHRVEPFALADSTQPGHRRFLVLWLVDPHYRIISTANVPPQQHRWWKPHALEPVLDHSGLPPELQDMVRDEVGEWPIGMDEANELRLRLMAERTEMMPSIERNFWTYNLCEH